MIISLVKLWKIIGRWNFVVGSYLFALIIHHFLGILRVCESRTTNSTLFLMIPVFWTVFVYRFAIDIRDSASFFALSIATFLAIGLLRLNNLDLSVSSAEVTFFLAFLPFSGVLVIIVYMFPSSYMMVQPIVDLIYHKLVIYIGDAASIFLIGMLINSPSIVLTLALSRWILVYSRRLAGSKF